MTIDLHIRNKGWRTVRPPEIGPPTTEQRNSPRVDEQLLPLSAISFGSYDIGSFELMRSFVEHVVTQNERARLGNRQGARPIVDWAAVDASVADARTLEQAIGRVVVLADRISRGVLDDARPGESPSSLKAEEPFFAFSMAGVTPDFGDESRYRTRLARRMTQVLPTRRRNTAAPATIAVPPAAAPLATTPGGATISAS